MSEPTAPTIIAQKRDGQVLDAASIRWLIDGFVAGTVADYQMSAFAMAVLLRGMNAPETAALTLAMRDSGRVADLSGVKGPRVDKHSTGGVGDKVSICLAPLVAACGVNVPMISGRGLGHTGGTLDKLEAIPGFKVDLPLARFERLVARHGFAMIGQTADLAPADRRLYAIRDVTATVESIPLITASILSKKLAEDLDALVMDVKVGRGAFMKNLDEARQLARSIVSTARAIGTPTTALLTRMDAPLGHAVGNALETAEAFELLHGRAPDDLQECTWALGSEMLRAAGVERTDGGARRRLDAAIASGEALKRMRAVVKAQGGEPRAVDEPDRLPQAPHRVSVKAGSAGYVGDVDAMAVAQVALTLGAGRTRADQQVDPRVGVLLRAKPGDAVSANTVIAELHVRERRDATATRKQLREAFTFSRGRPSVPSLVIERITR